MEQNSVIEKYVSELTPLILSIIVIIYVYFAKTPKFVKQLFNNSLFRIVILIFLFIFRYDKSPTISLTIALLFILTTYFINKEEIEENIEYVKAYREIQKEKRKLYYKE